MSIYPLSAKLLFTAFMAVLIPVYAVNYGWTNFLYFCDVALLLTLFGLWRQNRLAVSMAAVGILLPQVLWCADFFWQLCLEAKGLPHSGMTAYMFDEHKSLFLRGLSLFHGWLPFLLLWLVKKGGYDKRALWAWTAVMVSLCLYSWFFLPPAGALMADLNTPVNVNYVHGLDDTKPQDWLPAGGYLLAWMTALFAILALPTHLVLQKWKGRE
jgi:hypothetical protein